METTFHSDEFLFAYPEGIQNNFWNFARKKIIFDWLQKHRINNVMDVGSDRGIVTEFLFRKGIIIRGAELGYTTPVNSSTVPIQYGVDASKISHHIAHKIAAVSMFDVIEHVDNPVHFMDNVMNHFANAKHIIITVPAMSELWSNFDVYYGHKKRYTLQDVHNEMEKINFSVIESRYFFHSLYYIIRLNNFISKKRSIQFKSPSGIGKIFHQFIGYVFYFESFFVPSIWKGSSIICIAKRK